MTVAWTDPCGRCGKQRRLHGVQVHGACHAFWNVDGWGPCPTTWFTREQPDSDDERYADQESLDDHYGTEDPEDVPDWWEVA